MDGVHVPVAKETTSSKVSFSQSKNNNPTHIF
jgi:hypothetical protein